MRRPECVPYSSILATAGKPYLVKILKGRDVEAATSVLLTRALSCVHPPLYSPTLDLLLYSPIRLICRDVCLHLGITWSGTSC